MPRLSIAMLNVPVRRDTISLASMSDWTSTLSYVATDFPPDSDDDSLGNDDSLDHIMAQVDESSVTFVETPFTIAARNAQLRKHYEATSKVADPFSKTQLQSPRAQPEAAIERPKTATDVISISSDSEDSHVAQKGSSSSSYAVAQSASFQIDGSPAQSMLERFLEEDAHIYTNLSEQAYSDHSYASSSWQSCPPLTFEDSSEPSEGLKPPTVPLFSTSYAQHFAQAQLYQSNGATNAGPCSDYFDEGFSRSHHASRTVCHPAAPPLLKYHQSHDQSRYPLNELAAMPLEKPPSDPKTAKRKADAALSALKKFRYQEKRERKEAEPVPYRYRESEQQTDWSTLRASKGLNYGTTSIISTPRPSLPSVRLPVKGATGKPSIPLPLYRAPGSTAEQRRQALAYINGSTKAHSNKMLTPASVPPRQAPRLFRPAPTSSLRHHDRSS